MTENTKEVLPQNPKLDPRKPIPLLNKEFQTVAQGPCSIAFTNSSRFHKAIEIHCAPVLIVKQLRPFSRYVFKTSSTEIIEAMQRHGKTVTWEIQPTEPQ